MASSVAARRNRGGRDFFFWATSATAQWLELGEWAGTLEGVTEFSRQNIDTAGSARSRFQNIHSENRLTLNNSGAYIYDPRFLTFSLGGTFGLSDDWLTTEATRQANKLTLWGYDIFASVLPGKDLSLTLFANRNQSLLSRELSGRGEILGENRGATLFARRLFIPATLAFRQEIRDDQSRSGGVTVRSRDQRNVLTYEGWRGWTDSEMNLRYELVDLSNEILPSLSYQSHEGSLYYSLDFGEELNRRWDSRIRLFTRTGLIDLSTLNLDESLRIDHTDRLQTGYRYTLGGTQAVGGGTLTHSAGFHLLHRLYESLSTSLGLDATFQTLPGGQRDSYRGSLGWGYSKRIPWDGVLNIGTGTGLQYDTQRFETTESSVSQESHTAASPTAQPIQLNNPLVIEESVVVTKTAFGPLPAGCVRPAGPPTPLVLGRDYTLRTVGDFTEIVPIACAGTAPGINPEDTIAVDYRFRVSPSLAFTTIPWHFNLSVDYRWIRPYFIHEQTNQSLISGRDGRFLNDQRSNTLGTELRYDDDRVRASVLGEARRFTSRRVTYDMARSNQFLSYRVLPELNLTLSTDQTFFSYSQPQRETLTLGGRATLSYLTYIWDTNIFTDAFAGIRTLATTSMPNERIFETGLRMRGSYRKVEVLPGIEFFDRRRGETDTKDIRITLRLIRRF